jgi:AAA domain
MSKENPTERIGGLNLLDLSKERFTRVEWFWPNLIPMAELTLLNGDGGIGKTTAMLDLLARASSGKAMPCGFQHAQPLKVLIVAEEDRRGMLRAKLDIAGANHKNIRLITSAIGTEGEDEGFYFPKHWLNLRATIKAGGFDVVFIDALLNHIEDRFNISKPQHMRAAIRPLVDIAHETGPPIIGIRHIGKTRGSASTAAFGSAEARNLCRSELTCGEHPDREAHPGLVVLALSKANLSLKRDATAAWHLEEIQAWDDNRNETTLPRVRWSATPPKIHADDLLGGEAPKRRLPVDDAVEFLKRTLSQGAKPLPELLALGIAEGLDAHHLQRARKRAALPFGMEGKTSYWALTQEALDDALHLAREAKKRRSVKSVKSVIDGETRGGAPGAPHP